MRALGFVMIAFAGMTPTVAKHAPKPTLTNRRPHNNWNDRSYLGKPAYAAPPTLDRSDPSRPGGIDPSFSPPPT